MNLNLHQLYCRLADSSLGAIDRKVLQRFCRYATIRRHYSPQEHACLQSWTSFVRKFEAQLADALFPQGYPHAPQLNPLMPADRVLEIMANAITVWAARYQSLPKERQSGFQVRLMMRDAITHHFFFSLDPTIRHHVGKLELPAFLDEILPAQALLMMYRFRSQQAYDNFVADYTDLYRTYQRITGRKLSTFIVEDQGHLKRAVRKAGGIAGLAGITPDLTTIAHRDPNGRVCIKAIEDVLWEYKMV